MVRWIVEALAPIGCALALVLAVIGLGRAARTALHEREAFTVAFADIDCQPPEGLTRGEFLAEVQRLARQPARLHVLDDDLTARLRRAFASHPSVASVSRVHVAPSTSSAARTRTTVRVEFVPNEAVLAVCLAGDKLPLDGSALIETWSGLGRNALVPARAVDRNGVLLPVSSVRPHLPVFKADVAAPAGPAGKRWGDRRVADAAAVVAYLRPHLKKLDLADCDVEIVEGEVVFRKPGLRVVWGRAPGQERPGEAPAEVKLRRLLDYQAGHDGLECLEHDVRLLAYQGHFPLSPSARP